MTTNTNISRARLRAGSAFRALALTGAGLALGAGFAMPAYAQDDATQAQSSVTQSGNAVTTADSTTQGGQDIVITGSRIPIPANLTSASPITTVGQEDVQLQGVTRTEDLLNNLPQVFADQNGAVANGATGTAAVDLRNLGAQRTLVLINGRRLMPGDPESPVADLNFIPASLIKKVDVLTGGASSAYGADAVAGVVNFIMDTDFTGIRLNGQYSLYDHENSARPAVESALADSGYPYPSGHSANGGTVDLSAAFGTKFGDSGQGHISAYVGYRKINAVQQNSRDYSACALGADNGAGAPYCAGSATSKEGTFFTNLGTYYVNGNQFVPGDKTYNYGPLNYFQRPDERYTAGAFADYKISDAIHPYMEFQFMDDRTVAQIAPSGDFGNTLTVNCDNPLLSAQELSLICTNGNYVGQSVDAKGNVTGTPTVFTDANGKTYEEGNLQILRRNVEGGPRQDDLQHTDFRLVTGLKGDLGHGWSYDAYFQFGRVNYAETYLNDVSVNRLTRALNVVTDPATGEPTCRSVLDGTDTNCVPYNVFQTGGVNQAAVDYLSTPGFKRGHTEEQVASASITGDLGTYGIKSPWADSGVGINVGTEYRKESLEENTDLEFQTGDLAGQGAATLPISGSYKVAEAFAELRLPIIEDGIVKNLSFDTGYRYSHYENGISTFNTSTYKFEGDFAPTQDIAFRATYNRAVRAPNIQELFAPQRVALDGSTDPCAGSIGTDGTVNGFTAAECARTGVTAAQFGSIVANPSAQYNGYIGGNPDLKPEKATTITAGVVLTPRFLPGFSASVDWYDIKVKNTIQTIGADTIISTCAETGDPTFCGFVHRDQFGSIWRTSDGYVIDQTTNIGSVKTSGVDVSANYDYHWLGVGDFSVNMNGTYLSKFRTDNGVSAPYDCAGYFGVVCGTPAPKWRHRVRLTYTTESGIGISAQWRYFGPVKLDATSSNPTLNAAYADFNARIPSQSYFDLALTARATEHVNLRIGAENILDRDPPVVTREAGGNNAFYNGNTYVNYDVLGRYIYVGASLNF